MNMCVYITIMSKEKEALNLREVRRSGGTDWGIGGSGDMI